MNDFDAAARTLDPEQLQAQLTQLMSKIVFTVLPNAQRETPVRSGHLRRSETARVEAAGQRGVIGTNVAYAPFVHKHNPFFTRGLALSRDLIDELLQDAGLAFLRGVGGAAR